MNGNRGILRRIPAWAVIVGSLGIGAGLLVLPVLTDVGGSAQQLCQNFGAVFITAAVAAVFFNSQEVRTWLAGAVSTLLLQGDAVRRLSAASQEDLGKTILLERIGATTRRPKEIEDSLYEHMEELRKRHLSVPHRHNYRLHVSFTDVEGRPDVYRKHFVAEYIVSCRHLEDAEGVYKLRTGSKVANIDGAIDPDEAMGEFAVRIGDSTFTVDDAEVLEEEVPGAGTDQVVARVREDIPVDGEADVRIERQMLSLRRDPATMIFAAYPTKGFDVRLQYRADLSYDGSWYRTDPEPTESRGRWPGGEINPEPEGIQASRTGWVLPGEGIVLVHYPEP